MSNEVATTRERSFEPDAEPDSCSCLCLVATLTGARVLAKNTTKLDGEVDGFLMHFAVEISRVCTSNEQQYGYGAQVRWCYNGIQHQEGDIIRPRDCVLLKSGPRVIDLPFVAKVGSLWQTPEGEMMISLLWYYRSVPTPHLHMSPSTVKLYRIRSIHNTISNTLPFGTRLALHCTRLCC